MNVTPINAVAHELVNITTLTLPPPPPLQSIPLLYAFDFVSSAPPEEWNKERRTTGEVRKTRSSTRMSLPRASTAHHVQLSGSALNGRLAADMHMATDLFLRVTSELVGTTAISFLTFRLSLHKGCPHVLHVRLRTG